MCVCVEARLKVVKRCGVQPAVVSLLHYYLDGFRALSTFNGFVLLLIGLTAMFRSCSVKEGLFKGCVLGFPTTVVIHKVGSGPVRWAKHHLT